MQCLLATGPPAHSHCWTVTVARKIIGGDQRNDQWGSLPRSRRSRTRSLWSSDPLMVNRPPLIYRICIVIPSKFTNLLSIVGMYVFYTCTFTCFLADHDYCRCCCRNECSMEHYDRWWWTQPFDSTSPLGWPPWDATGITRYVQLYPMHNQAILVGSMLTPPVSWAYKFIFFLSTGILGDTGIYHYFDHSDVPFAPQSNYPKDSC